MNEFKELFVEKTAAAQSLKNHWTRMASTYGCMVIRLDRENLTIKPRPIIGWLIKLLCLDLHHIVLRDQIRSAVNRGKWLNYGKVEICFEKEGSEHRILLYLKKHEEFLEKLKHP